MKPRLNRVPRIIGWVGLCFGFFRLGMISGIYASQVAMGDKWNQVTVSWSSLGLWFSLITILAAAYLLKPAKKEVPG